MMSVGDGRLCFAVHLDGGMEVMAGGERVSLPAYGNNHAQRAMLAASLLKRCDPDALVSVVVWADDGEAWISRTPSEAHEADRVAARVGEQLAMDRRMFAQGDGGGG